jgi:ABC-type sugar transport system substrate-binding protein
MPFRIVGGSSRRVAAAIAVTLASSSCGEEPPPPAPPATKPTIGIVLGEPIAGLDDGLRAVLRDRPFETEIEASLGLATAQLDLVGRLLERKVALVVIAPVVPDVLFRARSAASTHEVPLIGLLRGDGKSGPWVGVGSTTLAQESGERAAAWLQAHGRKRPRVVAVEDPRWPETRRRVEATLRALEAGCGEIDLPLRAQTSATTDETAKQLSGSLARMKGADVLVAGDAAATAGAVKAAAQSVSKETILVVGMSDDPALIEQAKAAGSRLLLVTWSRDDLLREVAAGIDAALASPQTPVQREVPTALVGLSGESSPGGAPK